MMWYFMFGEWSLWNGAGGGGGGVNVGVGRTRRMMLKVGVRQGEEPKVGV